MNFKQSMGYVLLVFMLVAAIALFGGIKHEPKPIAEKVALNVSDKPEISEYHGITMEEQVTVDFGAIALIGMLIGITSLGGVVNGDKE